MDNERAFAPYAMSARWHQGGLPVALACLAGGAILRIWLALRSSLVEPWSDMRAFLELARIVGSEHGALTADRPMLYPWLLARAFAEGLSPGVPLYLTQGFFSLTVAALLARLSARWFGAPAGYATLALGCFSITFAQYSALALTETAFAAAYFGGVNLILAAPRLDLALGSRKARQVAAAARIAGVLLLAVAAVLRPSGLALAMGLLVGAAWAPSRSLHRGKRIAIGAASLALLVTSYLGFVQLLERETGVHTGPFPTAGFNLYLGNSPGARWDGGGATVVPPELTGEKDAIASGELARRLAFEHIGAHPAETLGRIAVRTLRLCGINPGRVEYDALTRYGLPAPIVVGWLAAEWIGVLLLSAVGVALAPRSIQRCLVLALAPYLAGLAISYVQTRYRIPVHLWLLPFAGATLARWIGPEPFAFATLQRRALLAATAIIVAGLSFDLATRFWLC
ncbi:MAG: hypothetical protein IT349_14630 [Candidatus Eisenbacteria bacterium]|nr:hypothetical protein [Candidatus Eisenbacteria bacterium]